MQFKNWRYVLPAALAGIAGTIVFDILGLVLPPGEGDVPNARGCLRRRSPWAPSCNMGSG